MLAMDKKDSRGRAGGKARAEILPPERKREIAQKAAIARWGIRAIYKGNFQQELGIDVDCFVLDDVQKTAVISQTGMARALGLSPRGNALPRFLSSKAMVTVGAELRRKIENPLKFQWGNTGAETAAMTVHGFDATLLIDLCNAITTAEADQKLSARYHNIANQAHIILGASGKLGITRLVYAISGYNPTTEEVIAAFKLYIQEEARKYEPEFPTELYMEWHRLYNLAIPDRGKPWHFKYLTVSHVYYPLAKSSGRILTLLRALRSKDGNQKKKLFQFLNDIGARALRIQLGRVLEMAESSPNKTEYEKKIIDRFGGQQQLELVLPIPSIEPQPPSAQLRLDLPTRVLSARCAAFPAERLGGLVLAFIGSGVLLDLTVRILATGIAFATVSAGRSGLAVP
jgi:P63C domain